jgi:predicted secreted hydrolase
MNARPWMLAAVVAIGVTHAAAPAAPRVDAPRTPEGYRLAVPPWRFEFPRDHAAHPEFRTEWWYYTGHLDAGGATYGFELTFFRVGIDPALARTGSEWSLHTLYFAHFALSDLGGRRFLFEEKIARPALGIAGADSTRLRTWIDDWSVTLAEDGVTHRLVAAGEDFAIDLALAPGKPPVIHGENGVSQKAEGVGRASHYYSLTRLAGTGTLTLNDRALPVKSVAWMDHEFGSNQLAAGQRGWDWFSLQLDDGRDLMLYRMRRDDGTADPWSSGTLIDRDGRARHLKLDAFRIAETATWKSPKSGGTYPAAWRIEVPGEELVLRVEPVMADQELVTGGAAGVIYWEGSVRASGTARGAPIAGRGYVELTGYAGRVPAF